MSTTLQQTRLPNGLEIYCLREEEVRIVYAEAPGYLKNGIVVREGDTVIDVGANIGVFSIWVYQQCNQNVSLYAFEPIPAIFQALEANAKGLDPEKIKVFPYGLSQENKMVTFAYHPRFTVLSTAYQGDWANELDMLRTLAGNLKNNTAKSGIIRLLPSLIYDLIYNFNVRKKLNAISQYEQVQCQVMTLSKIIEQQHIDQIDLLKIDVEKSELDVLLGIEDRDWQKIKQIVVEVQDRNGILEAMVDLLKKHGLDNMTIEQEPHFKETNVFMIYALRSAAT